MIGIFDSGVGGLSVFREIRKVLPEEKYIYWSDSAHCPYGEKTREYIIDRARSITRHLIEKGADIIVVACNTASAYALDVLEKEPMQADNPLFQIKDSEKLLITPHMAWGSVEARQRVVDGVYKNIEAYLNGEKRNVVNEV